MGASDEARRLAAKAAEDEYVLERLLEDSAAPEAMLGFHAQQAVEKLLKAALFLAGREPPRTHNLALLLDMARDAGLKLPRGAEALRELTPFAVLYRYDSDSLDEGASLDRAAVRRRISALRTWLIRLLAEAEGRQP